MNIEEENWNSGKNKILFEAFKVKQSFFLRLLQNSPLKLIPAFKNLGKISIYTQVIQATNVS